MHLLPQAYHAVCRLSKGDTRPEGSDVLGCFRSVVIRDVQHKDSHVRKNAESLMPKNWSQCYESEGLTS